MNYPNSLEIVVPLAAQRQPLLARVTNLGVYTCPAWEEPGVGCSAVESPCTI